MKLWDKGYDVNEEIEKFTVGDDYLLDKKLLFWDCLGSIAHAKMLCKIGVLTQKEMLDLKNCLKEIIELDKSNKFQILQKQEDCHTAIEEYLTEKLGDAGKKIHTARSRNDQVLSALKLYMKKETLEIMGLTLKLCSALLKFGNKNDILFPGFTHMQKAMPSTVSLWSYSFAESILDNLKILKSAYEVIDSCPLGSGAGYGVSINIDRQFVSDELGFSKVQNNVIYVQNSRGKNEALILSALMNQMLDVNKIATDLILFSMPEFGYFELPKEFTTGSSIMPQKKNPDVLELLRAKSKVVESLYLQVLGIIQSIPSGYNRDFQLTKKPLFEGIETTKASLAILASVFSSLKVNKINCEKACTEDIFATDIAYGHVKKGMPFREAYKKVAGELSSINIDDKYSYIKAKKHLGSPGNPGAGEIEENIKKEKLRLQKVSGEFESKINALIN